jgi:hypothetical protein
MIRDVVFVSNLIAMMANATAAGDVTIKAIQVKRTRSALTNGAIVHSEIATPTDLIQRGLV